MNFIIETKDNIQELPQTETELMKRIKLFHSNAIKILFPHFGFQQMPQLIRNCVIKDSEREYGDYDSHEYEMIISTPLNREMKRKAEIEFLDDCTVHETAHYLHHLTNPDLYYQNGAGFSPSLPRLSRELHLTELTCYYACYLHWNIVGKSKAYEEYLSYANEYKKSGMRLYKHNPNWMAELARTDKKDESFHPFLDNMNELLWEARKKSLSKQGEVK